MAKLNKLTWLFFSLLIIVISLLGIQANFFDKPKGPAHKTGAVNRLGSGLGNKETIGQQVVANHALSFPADHGEHSAFDIEWWYLTANLEDEQGNIYGLQWTLFRFRTPSPLTDKTSWSNDQLYMAHASINSLDSHWFAEKFARGQVGNAGVTLTPFQLYIDDWSWANSAANDATAIQQLLPAQLAFQIPLINPQKSDNNKLLRVSLALQQNGPFILQGDKGYSTKSADGAYASYYYSNPMIDITGQFIFAQNKAGPPSSSISVKGQAWFDHEWTSQLVDNQTLGWDWLSVHLDDGSKLMAFRMRIEGQADYITGTLVQADGTQTLLTEENLSLKPTAWIEVNQRKLPLSWQVNIPQFNVNIAVKTLKNEQWNPALIAYYEGMVGVTGSHKGKGFLELTGY
ncbi:lipocalin-like domain-containing protein [Paraglaciecola sp.]|uniref:lipocalin-like domain-containing protein n=1 Tax=Paraglaciecola sp. TaxID=1920173 RepID=UPI0030F3DDCE